MSTPSLCFVQCTYIRDSKKFCKISIRPFWADINTTLIFNPHSHILLIFNKYEMYNYPREVKKELQTFSTTMRKFQCQITVKRDSKQNIK